MSQLTEVEIDDDKEKKEVFLFREPIVLLTILCLRVPSGMTLFIGGQKIKDFTDWNQMLQIWFFSTTAVPMIGIIFFAFLSGIHGRKPTFIILYTLAFISVILHCIPGQEIATFSFTIFGLYRGGSLVMGAIAITEYCSPKHRFTYLIFNSILINIFSSLTNVMLTLEARLYPYVQAFQILLMLVCLISTCKWPESPYWLASQEKFEDSKNAFLWLRGEDGRKERNSLLEERRTPGPFQLYWMSFFIAVGTISVSVFTSLGSRFWHRWRAGRIDYSETEEITKLCGSIVIATLVSVLSYFVRRKVLFLLVSGISFLLSYTIAIWLRVDSTVEDLDNRWFSIGFFISDMISTFGTVELGLTLCIELIPLKYNTHMTCSVLLCRYIVHFPFLVLYAETFAIFEQTRVFFPLFTTLSLVGVIIYCYFAPETKGKTLLEIQKAYTPERSKENCKDDHELVTHI